MFVPIVAVCRLVITILQELDNKGYICPQCKTSYSPLEVDKLMDFALGTLICEICHAEVVDNENAESLQGSKDRMQRFNHQMRFIREGLQKSEAMLLPACVIFLQVFNTIHKNSSYSFDVAAWVKNNPSDSDKQKSSQSGSGLKVAGSDPNQKADEGVGVMMAMDKDEFTRKQERDAEAEMKRQQNALPAWHLKSTITGDLTALGVKEHARTEVGQSSNDDILKGLGVVGGRQELPVVHVSEDVKPVLNKEADCMSFLVSSTNALKHFADYDQYYASLAVSANTSTHATPTGLSAPGSSDFGGDEEEERKPNIEYLDSLNEYRKRSRSREDEGAVTKAKIAKVTEPSLYNGFGAETITTNGRSNGYTPRINGYTQENGIEVDVDAVLVADVQATDDPLVYGAFSISINASLMENSN